MRVATLKDALENVETAILEMMGYFDNLGRDDLPALCKGFALLRENKDEIDRLHKMVNEQYEALSREIIPNAMRAVDFESVRSSGKLFSLATRVNANIPEAKREVGHQWLKDEANIPELIKETVNPKQLTAFVSSYFESYGKWPPEEAVTVYLQDYISIRKA